jgi:hypothetical protein
MGANFISHDLSAGAQYSLFKINITHAKTTGGGACLGCIESVCLSLDEIYLRRTDPCTLPNTLSDFHVIAPAQNNVRLHGSSQALKRSFAGRPFSEGDTVATAGHQRVNADMPDHIRQLLNAPAFAQEDCERSAIEFSVIGEFVNEDGPGEGAAKDLSGGAGKPALIGNIDKVVTLLAIDIGYQTRQRVGDQTQLGFTGPQLAFGAQLFDKRLAGFPLCHGSGTPRTSERGSGYADDDRQHEADEHEQEVCGGGHEYLERGRLGREWSSDSLRSAETAALHQIIRSKNGISANTCSIATVK